jgi:hypothetical protein
VLVLWGIRVWGRIRGCMGRGLSLENEKKNWVKEVETK